ncbi:hypothetical protein FC39_GL000120 [Lactobacillus hamsteri DSM 5661 = JCM 6256]|uniref:Uncharacterized protein n=1 Tax=Lactobacillus hamsteri DSM 5661 = JCM 6256 TaxID=1423754 RepID=A0A0R1Y5H9_9LACO|nr:hypothetical protein FC39_GL000120 [Lactobacillus hamsteri DSM 5661 = JCM 6256]
MQDFFKALKTTDLKTIKETIYSKQAVGSLMHKTLLTFRHNLQAVLNGATLMAVLKASIVRSSKSKEQLLAILILLIS